MLTLAGQERRDLLLEFFVAGCPRVALEQSIKGVSESARNLFQGCMVLDKSPGCLRGRSTPRDKD